MSHRWWGYGKTAFWLAHPPLSYAHKCRKSTATVWAALTVTDTPRQGTRSYSQQSMKIWDPPPNICKEWHPAAIHVSELGSRSAPFLKSQDECRPTNMQIATLRPWAKPPNEATAGFLTLRNWQIIRVCCFKPLRFVTRQYTTNIIVLSLKPS